MVYLKFEVSVAFLISLGEMSLRNANDFSYEQKTVVWQRVLKKFKAGVRNVQ